MSAPLLYSTRPNAIQRGVRIVHRLYGRGVVECLYPLDRPPQARVQFDGEIRPRRVLFKDLEREPAAMPACVPA